MGTTNPEALRNRISELNQEFLTLATNTLRTESDLERENKLLKATVSSMQVEMDKFKKPPLIMCEVKNIQGDRALVKVPNGHVFYVHVSSHLKESLSAGDHVLAEQKSLTLIKKIDASKDFAAENFVIMQKPSHSWKDVGGLDMQKIEIKEVIEYPLLKPHIFEKIGITPPKGILLHGPPGCGKTLLAKAVANSTNATFIEIVASELVQKFIGEGAKLVKQIFELAKKKAPSIIFIDEIDALASERMDIGTSGEREVQRTFMQLLAEIDGFKNLGGVKVIAATNRLNILDKAIVRPGRLDRLIEIGYPCKDSRKNIFKIYTQNMNTSKLNANRLAELTDDYSGAEIKAACTEAGYFALRDNRTLVSEKDLIKGIYKVKSKDYEDFSFMNMFG